jgi:protein-S-isoprenylcysteine O-methyltransferase Ste14
MSLIPLIKAGFWNAWIPMLAYVLIALAIFLGDRISGDGELYRRMGEELMEKKEKRINAFSSGILICLFILSVFLPLKLRSTWFYLGAGLWLAGMVIFVCALSTVARTPVGRVFTVGVYRFSRHPLYLSLFLILLGTGTASASWLFLSISIGYFLFQNPLVVEEENDCAKSFGLEYLEYMKRTPRWLGIPKSK